MKALCLIFAIVMVGCTVVTSGCTAVSPVVCAVETSVAGALSTSVSTALTCTHADVIQKDILTALGKTNLCTQSLAKPIAGTLLCPVAVQAVMAVASTQVPATWGCAPGSSTSTLAATLTAACIAAVGP